MAFKFTDENFKEEALECSQLVLVDFYADWCGPCKMMGPVIEELAAENKDVAKIGKINTDESPATATKYRVMTIPSLLFFKGGEVVDTVIGVVPKEKLQEKINQYK